jgi:esterase/lipase superfamily enzyme
MHKKVHRLLPFFLLVLFLSGCSASLPLTHQVRQQRVFFATDRNDTENAAKPSEHYGKGRGRLSYGTCDVTLPPGHRISKLESTSLLRLYREDPEQDVLLKAVSPKEEGEFYKDLALRVTASKARRLIIYVHGYYMTFEDAAIRMAQMAEDLGLDSPPVFYSWPSRGEMRKYPIDETNVEWTQPNLKRFLEAVAERSGASEIYLIAHSMGNRVLTKAFSDLMLEKPGLKSRFKALILTAPDIDTEVFKRDIAPRLTAAGVSVTLYVSLKDKALHLSKDFHGYPRAGDSSEEIIVIPGMDTIDVSEVDNSFTGHSYYIESRQVLSDLYYLINSGLSPASRFSLEPAESSWGRYWKFKK